MYKSKNNTNGNEVILDYDSLVNVATIVAAKCRDEVNHHISKIEEDIFLVGNNKDKDVQYSSAINIHLEGERLLREASMLAESVDLLCHLVIGKQRNEITIINHEQYETNE